jgi:hypothetical protein
MKGLLFRESEEVDMVKQFFPIRPNATGVTAEDFELLRRFRRSIDAYHPWLP